MEERTKLRQCVNEISKEMMYICKD